MKLVSGVTGEDSERGHSWKRHRRAIAFQWVMGSFCVSQELGRESTNTQKQEYAFCDLRMVTGRHPVG